MSSRTSRILLMAKQSVNKATVGKISEEVGRITSKSQTEKATRSPTDENENGNEDEMEDRNGDEIEDQNINGDEDRNDFDSNDRNEDRNEDNNEDEKEDENFENPLPNTVSIQAACSSVVPIRDGMDFSSDDSVADPDYKAGSEESEDSSETENRTVENIVPVSKGKKRKPHPESWKRNISKEKVTGGEDHQSKTKLMKAKQLGPACKPTCHFKCSEKICEDSRKAILSEFWSKTKNMDMKRQFVASMVRTVPVARIREETGRRSGKRKFTRKYGFDINHVRINVCQKFFLSTLSISETFVSTSLLKKLDGGVVSDDQRGKQEAKNKIPENVKEGVRDHINKFPTVESHYSRERSKRTYLGSHLNIQRMYDLYKQECDESNIPESNIAKIWLYTDIFNTEFNMAFKVPYNDTCDECDKLLLAKNETPLDKEKTAINEKYELHLKEASKRYALKRIDKETARESKGKMKLLTVDLQKCLPTPVLTNAQSFYKLKLWTYNYTINDSSSHSTSCMMWDESKSGRGANQMASGFIKWAETIPLNVSEVTLWSDNCPSQNRNIIMVMAYFWVLHESPTVKTINHKFLLRGHTHLEVDGDHSLIERERKRTPYLQIMTPWDWQQIARSCSRSKAFRVFNMEVNDFKDVKVLYNNNTSPFISRKKTNNNEDFQMSKVVHLQVRREEMGMLFFKTDFDSDSFQCVDLNRNGRRVNFPTELPALRDDLNPISTKKYNHLQSLLPWIPNQFHNFYRNLAHSDRVSDEI